MIYCTAWFQADDFTWEFPMNQPVALMKTGLELRLDASAGMRQEQEALLVSNLTWSNQCIERTA